MQKKLYCRRIKMNNQKLIRMKNTLKAKHLKYIAVAAFLFAAGYTSCKKDREQPITVSVGAQSGEMTEGTTGTVMFPVKTANLVDGTFTASVANLPDGISIQGSVAINDDKGTLTLAGDGTQAAGMTTLTLTLAGAKSKTFTLTVKDKPATAPPTITEQPEDVTVAEGDDVEFTVEATGTAPLAYQWQYSNDDGTTWGDLDGETSATFSFTEATTATNGWQYRCIVSNDYGEAISAAVTLTVTNSTLSLSAPETVWYFSGEINYIYVTSNTSWTAVSNQSWLTFPSGSSGSAGTEVALEYQISLYTSTDTREAIIKVTTTDGTKSAELIITQGGYPTVLTVSPETLNVPASGGDYGSTIKIISDVEGAFFDVVNRDEYDWVHILNSLGYGFDHVDVDPNTSPTPRTATFTVKEVQAELISATFTIIQDGAPAFNGDGTSGSPYLINNRADLDKLSELINAGTAPYADAGKWYRLENDIILPEIFKGTSNHTPIGTSDHSFIGNFDGNNKIISNLTVNTTSGYAGLFGRVNGGTIKNLGVTGSVIGTSYVGGIAGSVSVGSGGTISNCYTTCTVTGSVNYVGGITGRNDGTVNNCYATGAIKGTYYVGGIIGSNIGTVSACYATGAISGANYVGGIVGDNYGGTVSNCVALNPSIEKEGSDVGTRFGRVAGDDSGMLSNNYAYENIPVLGVQTSGSISDTNGGDLVISDIGSLFTWTATLGFATPPWTVANNRLPGLFGTTVEIPSHIH